MKRFVTALKVLVVSAICVAAYFFPYLYLGGVWWRAIPCAAVILLGGLVVYGRGAFEFFGLKMSLADLGKSLLLLAVLVPAAAYVIFHVVVVDPLQAHRYPYSVSQVHQFFQVFNDEIVVRAALLTLVLRIFPHPKTVVVALAAAFSVGHYFLYGYYGDEIGLAALVSLFSFGAIANLLFVRYRHIGYSFALHYAWNMERINSEFYYRGAMLSEGRSFNYIEGSPWVVVGSLTAFLLLFAAYAHAEKRQPARALEREAAADS